MATSDVKTERRERCTLTQSYNRVINCAKLSNNATLCNKNKLKALKSLNLSTTTSEVKRDIYDA